ncbi:hypothetical protein HGRIS_010281 [Hohenbuehelia grisea]
MVRELVEAITPFYFSERLFALRVLIPLLRANENPADSAYEVSADVLPKLLPDAPKFADSVIDEYLRKTKASVPEYAAGDPRKASQWAKQNMKEQLILLEVLFWTMWGFAPCTGPLVVKIYETAYSARLGHLQTNSTLLLDDEGVQLLEDSAALWMTLTIEVLELERLAEPDAIQLSPEPSDSSLYTSAPDSLKRIHELVVSHTDSQFACTYLAWTFVLSRFVAAAEQVKEIPSHFSPFYDILLPHRGRGYSKDNEPVHTRMAQICLQPGAGLFNLVLALLTRSPLFVTAVAWRTGSSVTDPNAIAFRSVIKGLLVALVELVPVELIPDFDVLVEVWIALFGRSESESIAGICTQFWRSDWPRGITRRAIIDVARSRFPVQFKPLVKLLRAMSGAGFLDTDPLSTADHSHEGSGLTEDRDLCDRHVFYYLQSLPTFSQVIPASACTGPNALYERVPERYGSSSSTGLTYVNLHPIRLPGGSVLPARSTGRLLSSDGGDFIVVCWQHEHSGWKVMLEVLTDYVNRRRLLSGLGHDISFRKKRGDQSVTLRLEDVGLEMPNDGDDEMIVEGLDLIRCLIQDNPAQAEQLVQAMESGEPVVSHTMTEAQPPDLVQLTTMILEEALSRPHVPSRDASHSRLITSAMSVLSALLVLPTYSNRVWLYIRSTTALFGSERATGFSSVALAAERLTGHYTMTLALLHLVQQLFNEAASWYLPENPRLQQVKEEVLLRAVRFVHTEIWVEHLGWKYAQLGDRFEVGRRITSLYTDVLKHSPPHLQKRPFPALSQALADVLLLSSTTSTITPLVSPLSSGGYVLKKLYHSRRFGDARRLIFLLESHLRLVAQILTCKQKSNATSTPCLLEQALCSRSTGIAMPADSGHLHVDPIDTLTSYVKERDMGDLVPLESIRVLRMLCASLASCERSPPSIIGHLSNPESTVASLVRIVQHPYDDLSLRKAVWGFISLAVDKEPALAGLFVTGQFRTPPDLKGKGKVIGDGKEPTTEVAVAAEKAAEDSNPTSAIDVARDILSNWSQMWEMNPSLLSSVMRFLHVVWQHGLEHKLALNSIREDKTFWEQIVSLACEESTPTPDYLTESFVVFDNSKHSNLHDAVSTHAYRTLIKSYAARIIALDIDIHMQTTSRMSPPTKPPSVVCFESRLNQEDLVTDLLSEAASNSYEPHLHDELVDQFKLEFPSLSLDLLAHQEPAEDRDLGDDFTFSTSLLLHRLQAYGNGADEQALNSIGAAERQLTSVNLNLSLAHTQSLLAESWATFLRRAGAYFKNNAVIRPIMLNVAASVSFNISQEQRSGDMVAAIHAGRLALLLAILELAWFSSKETSAETKACTELVRNVRGIMLNDVQSPAKSFLGATTTPFHQTLLQIIYFCTRQSSQILQREKSTTAEQRLTVTSMVESALGLVINALRRVFDSACTRADIDLDRDMELLVAVFEQCTRRDLSTSSTTWLARCQEVDLVKASLNLFVHADLVGLSDLPLLLSRKRPLYVPHILVFHMALASIPSAGQRLASDGVLSAFSNNGISAAISSGLIDITLPEVPGDRSPAHRTYCSMLSIITGVTRALGRQNHYFDAEASGLLQLYDEQLSRALSWTAGKAMTFALLEEMEQVVQLFYALADNAPSTVETPGAVQKVLRSFTKRALLLLQQLNYAVTHPNHLASLLEPVTAEERAQLEKEVTVTEPLKRPLVAQLVHRLFKLSSNILATLICISRADTVLTREQEEWSLQEAWVVPHSKIVLGEPASLGTLLELGNSTLDVLRELAGHPAGQTLTRSTASTNTAEVALDVRQAAETARRNLESVLLYAATQLVMWLSKPELENTSTEGEGEEMAVEVPRTDDRRAPKPSLTLAERLRRGMTGEMAADLQSLLAKAQPVIGKSDAILGKGRTDITPILSNFLRQRIVTSA